MGNIDAIGLANLHRIEAWRLSAHCMHPGGGDFDIFPIADELAKQPFRDRTPTNVPCADEKNVFHHVAPRNVTRFQSKGDPGQVNRGKGGASFQLALWFYMASWKLALHW